MVKNSHTQYAPWLRDIPKDWSVDRLKDIIPKIVGGGTPSSAESDYWEDGDIIWVTPTDFSSEGLAVEICDSERKITRAGLAASSANLLPKGAVIMASRATIGSVRIAGRELTTNQGFISFVCDEKKLHHRFLYYVIVGYLGDYFAETAPGTTFNEISRGKAKQEPIGFPSFNEQMLIADYLDSSCQAISRITSLNEISAKYNQIKGVLHDQLQAILSYRKALIHECVTGRRRVTDVQLKRVLSNARA